MGEIREMRETDERRADIRVMNTLNVRASRQGMARMIAIAKRKLGFAGRRQITR